MYIKPIDIYIHQAKRHIYISRYILMGDRCLQHAIHWSQKLVYRQFRAH